MKKSNIIDRIKNSYILMFLIFSIVLITSSVIFRNIKYDNIVNSNKITMNTTLNNNQGYHPKVISFEKEWNGYKYWMSFTPYPKKDETKENPVVNVSNDIKTWEEPEGIKNPLDIPENADEEHYNSDTHLVYNEDLNQLEIFWRYVDDEKGEVTIFTKTSTDGRNWTPKTVFLKSSVRKKLDYVSPAIIYEKGKYKIWYVDKKNVYYIEKSGDTVTKPRLLEIKYANGYRTWHIDVIYNNDKKIYELVACAYENINYREKMSVYYSYSSDNIKWETPIEIITPSTKNWDAGGLYRSSILYENEKYYIFYSGYDINDNVGIGIMYGEDMKRLRAFI